MILKCGLKNIKAIINKIKMLQTFNCLDLDILAPGYLSDFFLTDSQNSKLMKHLQLITLKLVDWRHFT